MNFVVHGRYLLAALWLLQLAFAQTCAATSFGNASSSSSKRSCGSLGNRQDIDHGNCHVHDVIVIGAGLSGLGAARMLQDDHAGIDVIVLEGSSIIGGRTKNKIIHNVTCELGAQFVMGGQGNPVTIIIDDNGLQTAQLTELPPNFYDERNGRLLEESEAKHIVDKGNMWFLGNLLRNRVNNVFQAFLQGSTPISNQSMSESAASFFRSHLNSIKESDHHLVRWIIEEYYGRLDYGGNPKHMGTEWIGEGMVFIGEQRALTKGFGQVPAILARGLDVRLEQVVESIEYHHDDNDPKNKDTSLVTVTTSNGVVYRAKKLIVTVPLGVLQHNKILFSPPLPQEKEAAIARLGMGTLEKVYMVFDTKFWPDGGINFVNDEHKEGELPSYLDVSHVTGQPTLVVFLGGEGSTRTLQTMSDEQIVEKCLEKLGIALGNDKIHRPVATHVTRWQEDPLAMGSYSYIPVGASPRDMDEYAKPVDGVLFFAGEATIGNGYQTTHGALLSGYREADNVLQSLQGKVVQPSDTSSFAGMVSGYMDCILRPIQFLHKKLYMDLQKVRSDLEMQSLSYRVAFVRSL